LRGALGNVNIGPPLSLGIGFVSEGGGCLTGALRRAENHCLRQIGSISDGQRRRCREQTGVAYRAGRKWS
jgi:hypothetical protein